MKKKIRGGLVIGLLICLVAVVFRQYGVSEKTTGLVLASTLTSANPALSVAVVYPWHLKNGQGITLPGRARASKYATLFFRVSGPLSQVHASPGDQVKKGQLLLQLDDRDYQRQVDVMESKLKSAQANLQKMQTGARKEDVLIIEQSIQASRSDLDLAQKELKRHEFLLKNNAVSEQAYDRSRNAVQILRAKTLSLEQQLAREKSGSRKEDITAARAGIEELGVQLEIARDRLGDTRLMAPFDGVVTSRLPQAFEMVGQGEPVMSLHNISTIEIPVDVPENKVDFFLDRERQNICEAKFLTKGDQLFQARLVQYSTRADRTTGTYEFVFAVTPKDSDLIFPGMTAEVSIKPPLDKNLSKLVIPLESLMGVSKNSAQVFLVDPQTKKARKQIITFETLVGEENVVVTAGLSPKDLVVSKGSGFIRPGQPLNFELPQGKL
ncbi:MAG: efflux RND transporter periplasmic adaptor subunit [Desulfobacteraceae bacterium]|nr:efflux RND transporter periplasmic adaptor subunit [Desulfobacteraceae bacterium]